MTTINYKRTINEDTEDSLLMISRLIESNSRVLDLGTAGGALGEYLSTRNGCLVDGIERDPVLADLGTPFYRKLSVADLEISKLADIFPDNQYDFIILADVLEHLRDVDRLLTQIPSRLSEDGHLLLSVPNVAHVGVVAELLSGKFTYRNDGILDSTHLRFFTRSSLCDLLEKHGFEVLSISPLRKDIRETEFGNHFLDSYPPAILRHLLAQPDALTYQFIVDAVYNPAAPGAERGPKTQLESAENQLSFGLQIFWRSEGEDYSSDRNCTAAGVIGDDRQTIQFHIPPMNAVVPDHFRIDLADRPGLINLYGMRLIAGDGKELWGWHGDMTQLAAMKSRCVQFFPGVRSSSCILLTGDDSQIELDIAAGSLAELTSGGVFLVELGWPLSADFLPVVNWINKRRSHKLISRLKHQLTQERTESEVKLGENARVIERLQHRLTQERTESEVRLGENARVIERLQHQLTQERTESEVKLGENARVIERLQHRLDEAFLVIANLETTRRAMTASFSWRLTAPLRWVGWGLRRVRRFGLVFLEKHLNYSGRSQEPILPDGMMGNLEFPQLNTTVEQNFLNVSGWIFATQSPLVKLYSMVDGKNELPLTYGYERPDVFQLFPGQMASLKSGFLGIVTLQSTAIGMVRLDIWAEFQNGSKVRCFSRRVIHSDISTRGLHPSRMVMFLRMAIGKAWRSFREGRLPMSPSRWWLDLQRNYIWMIGAEQRHHMSQATHRAGGIQDPYRQWIETNRITTKLRTLMQSDAQRLATMIGVKISLVVPVYNTPRQFLEEMIQSVLSQFYQNWELCLVDDASTAPYVREVLEAATKLDPRVRVQFRNTNGHICEATNDAINVASGDFVALLDHDDTLPPDALLHVVECVYEHPEVDWIYTDEDKIDATGLRFDPQFKGAWNPEMAITHNYTHHLTVIRRELISKVGGMRKGFEGAQDLDLFLRVAETTTSARIRHIPQICYHWRSHEESTASQGTQKTYVFDSACRAIQDALIRRKLSAEPFLPALAKKHGMCLYQLRWKNSLREGREVTIVIPTKDRVDLLKRCVSSLRETVRWQFVKLLIVDDRSTDPATLEYLRELENGAELRCRVIRPTMGDDGFNYARLINQAAVYVDTPYFLQLNNDVEAIHPGWLEDLMGWMTVEGVGIVGARLVYPDHTVQHAGVVVGPHGGLADHQFHQLPDSDVGYLALLHAARNVSAVTGACMLTPTDLFREIGGFDEENFAVEYNDVDFCLRVIDHGKRVVYSPQATLCHLTSASRGKSYNPEEHLGFIRKYKGFKDPFFSRNILLDSMWMTVNGRYTAHASRMKEMNVLLVTQALTLTGAPIVAYELARYFSDVMGFKVSVVSLQDGPVSEKFEESGISVHVLPDFPDMLHMSATEAHVSLKGIGDDIDIEAYDLVVCNTLTCFWGVVLADMFKVPSVWHIHESVGVTNYNSAMFADTSMRELVAASFMKASRTVFQAEATRAIYADFDVCGRFRTIPGGLSLNRIDQYRATHSKNSIRQKYGISKESQIVTLIGTTCERKGQAVFLDSIRHLESKFSIGMPDNLVFLLVGAIDGPYLDLLKQMIVQHGLKNVLLVGETKDIYDYYALSDVFVCASYEESFPMVVLLAMAFELPIVSTNVFGIPEIVSDGHEAILIPPGQPEFMADAIQKCLIEKESAVAMANRAYAKLHRLFDNDQLHSRHADLAKEVAIEGVRATIY